jgi:hypothetical protein
VGNRQGEGLTLRLQGLTFLQLDLLTEAKASFAASLKIHQELDISYHVVEDQACLAHLARLQGDENAPYLTQVLTYLAQHPRAEGTDRPFDLYLICIEGLQAQDKQNEADQLLSQAQHILQERAVKIKDETMRQSFLNNVAAHREIVRLYEAMAANNRTRETF